MRACKLINLQTGQVVQARSIKEFCQKVGFKHNEMFHITPILDGERLHHKGWCLPEYWNHWLELKDCYGHTYQGHVRDFLFGYKVRACTLFNLMRGRKDMLAGLSLKDTKIVSVPLRPYKVVGYSLRTPNGRTMQAKTQTSLARQLQSSLTYRHLGSLLRGYTAQARGFRVRKIKMVPRFALQPK